MHFRVILVYKYFSSFDYFLMLPVFLTYLITFIWSVFISVNRRTRQEQKLKSVLALSSFDQYKTFLRKTQIQKKNDTYRSYI